MLPTRVSIIGCAGRLGDGEKMDRNLFHQMVRKAEHIITDVYKLAKSDVFLVSGGSAWADHIAVRLWLESASNVDNPASYAGLRLFLPCLLDSSPNDPPPKFCGKVGVTLNSLHDKFTEKMDGEFDSRADIVCAQALGAELNCHFPGFFNRNRQVAQSEYVIAFTWHDSMASAKAGGTKHTWDCSPSDNKIHVPLASLQHANPVISALHSSYNSSSYNRDKNVTRGTKRKEVPE